MYSYQDETRKISGTGTSLWQTEDNQMRDSVNNLENVAPPDDDHEMTDAFEFPRSSVTSRAQGGTRGGCYDSDSSEPEYDVDRCCIQGVRSRTR